MIELSGYDKAMMKVLFETLVKEEVIQVKEFDDKDQLIDWVQDFHDRLENKGSV